jgi:hypothetical protein
MLPGDFLQVSVSRRSVAQGIEESSKGAGPRERSRVSPTLGATLVVHNPSVMSFKFNEYETYKAQKLTIQKLFVQTEFLYLICDKKTKFFPLQHYLTGDHKRDGECLLRGTK